MDFLRTIPKPQYVNLLGDEEHLVNVSLLALIKVALQDYIERKIFDGDKDWRVLQDVDLEVDLLDPFDKKWVGYYDIESLFGIKYTGLFDRHNGLDEIIPELIFSEKSGKAILKGITTYKLMSDVTNCLKFLGEEGFLKTRGRIINESVFIRCRPSPTDEIAYETPTNIFFDRWKSTNCIIWFGYAKGFVHFRNHQDILEDISKNINDLDLHVTNNID